MNKLPAVIFDVNETLLDLRPLAPFFTERFGDEQAMRAWFAQTILYSQTLSLSSEYVAFGELGVAVLKMQAEIASVSLHEADIDAFKNQMSQLPLHQDVKPALEALKQQGFRLFTLTNNSTGVQQAQLEHASILSLFDQVFSVEPAQAFKPAPATYHQVQEKLAGQFSAFCMVACHTWDIIGAAACGWQTALILRPGNAPLAVGSQPDMICADLHHFVEQITARSV